MRYSPSYPQKHFLPRRTYSSSLAALTFGVLVLAGAFVPCVSVAQANDSAMVSNTGEAVPEAASDGSRVSRAFKGMGRELAPGEVDDALAENPASSITADQIRALSLERPKTGKIGKETVIGTDDRVRVNPTTGRPARYNVYISFVQNGGSFRCSGSLIGPNTVATAGHCVHTGGPGGSWSTNVVVYPGRNGTSFPYGSCTARTLYSVTGWTNSSSDNYDYGAIKLNCNVGNTTGWYGFFWTSSSLRGLPTNIWSYPGDLAGQYQWKDLRSVTVSQTTRTFYKNDTFGGSSGAGVWYSRTGCGRCLFAIHAYGTYGSYPYSTNNHGTRIRQAVYNNLLNWRNAP